MIKEYFWRRVVEIAEDLGLLPECTKTRDFRMSVQKWGSLLIAGQIDGKVVSKEATAVLCWAWRALYAEIISKRTGNQGALDFERAVWITYRYAFSRVTAEGYKWRRWYLRQRFWQEGKRKKMAEKYHISPSTVRNLPDHVKASARDGKRERGSPHPAEAPAPPAKGRIWCGGVG